MPAVDTQTCRFCSKPVYCRRLCRAHYSRERRYGSPTGRPAEWGDPTFRGRGRLKCGICGEPIRDHKITETCL